MFREQEYLTRQIGTISNNSLFNDVAVKFPEPQYLGCKHKILSWIFKHFPKDKDVKTVLDGFAGSQSFSFHSKKSGYTVYTNDFMNYSHQIGISLIENKNEIIVKHNLLAKKYKTI